MKTKWITPRTEIEAFVPDEYVAACWGVGCLVDRANHYEETHGIYGGPASDRNPSWASIGCSHEAAYCGTSGNQVIRLNPDGTPNRMVETGTNGLGDLDCTLTNANYIGTVSISSVTVGSTIYWTTSSGDRIWHHVGLVTATVPGRPNAS